MLSTGCRVSFVSQFTVPEFMPEFAPNFTPQFPHTHLTSSSSDSMQEPKDTDAASSM